MNLLHKISRIFIVIILVFFIPSCCKKDPTNDDNTEYDKYIIEMNGVYRLSRVTHIVGNNNVEFEKSYEYSDKFAKVHTKDGSLKTYFLNQSGLADSCLEGNNSIQYHYDQNNFLISYSYLYGSIVYYEYSNGNRIKFIWGSDKSYYQYNSQINLIDIDSFNGTYLGKLNKNLIQSRQLEFLMASNGLTTTYQYTLNPAGLVILRTGITTYNSGGPQKKSISEFEYIVNN
jgi:hypothetical protein